MIKKFRIWIGNRTIDLESIGWFFLNFIHGHLRFKIFFNFKYRECLQNHLRRQLRSLEITWNFFHTFQNECSIFYFHSFIDFDRRWTNGFFYFGETSRRSNFFSTTRALRSTAARKKWTQSNKRWSVWPLARPRLLFFAGKFNVPKGRTEAPWMDERWHGNSCVLVMADVQRVTSKDALRGLE